jgi:hypothetical protein
MFARTQILVDLPKISSKVSFIIASRRGILEKYLLQNPREENENGWKREIKSGKSSSITIAQDMVVGSEKGDLFILGEANLPLLDLSQVSTTKQMSRSQG